MREFVGFLLYSGERLKGARRNIEKSGGVAEGHDVGFLLYCGERLKGARRNIEKSGNRPKGARRNIVESD